MKTNKIRALKEYIEKSSWIKESEKNKVSKLLEKFSKNNIKNSERKELITFLEFLNRNGFLILNEYEKRSGDNIIGSGKIFKGDFEETIKLYNGYQWNPEEITSIKNLQNPKYSELKNNRIKYIKSDQSLNDSVCVIMRLKEANKYVYTAFINVRGKDYEEKPSEDNNSSIKIKEDEIRIIKSIPFNEEDGKDILGNFIVKIYNELM